MGGRVALVARHLAPEAVSRVTLLDIAPGPIPVTAGSVEGVLGALLAAPGDASGRGEMRDHLLAQGLSPALAEWLVLNLAPGADGRVHWRIDRGALAALNDRTRALDLWPLVEAATAPTRCIRGGASPFVTDRDLDRLGQLGATTHTLAGAGHFVHVDALGELVTILASTE
jgi:pimeloyl-ACP methyl ester carboxylesterase